VLHRRAGERVTLRLSVPVHRDLPRRATAEFVGSALLVAIVVGSGIAAQRLSPGDVGLQLLENAVATGAGLVALILAFGAISGAHFNPVVTMADRILGGMSTRESGVYVVVQVAGACIGAMVANVMFDVPAIDLSTHTRASGALWIGEAVAAFGLVLVILGVVRAGRTDVAAFAVGAYIVAAYWFTSSTSFANPAVTVGRMLSNTFAGIAPSSVPMFVVMQVLGALGAIALARYLFTGVDAAELVVPHEPQEPT
jgi:arsenate reductase